MRHERSAWCNGVLLELWLLTLISMLLLLARLGGEKTADALLVHLRARRYTIDGHIEEAPWSNDGKQTVDVLEDVDLKLFSDPQKYSV